MQCTETAMDEIDAILKGAMTYGAENVRRLQARLQRVIDQLESGVGLGSGRSDLGLGDGMASFRSRLSPSRSSSTETSNSSCV